MQHNELIQKLAEALAEHTKPAIPLNIDLWDMATISQYLKRDVAVVRERYACKPDFPVAIRLPTTTGKRGHPLYKAVEIIQWTEKYRERCR